MTPGSPRGEYSRKEGNEMSVVRSPATWLTVAALALVAIVAFPGIGLAGLPIGIAGVASVLKAVTTS